MIPEYLLPLANHLWQSTLVTGAVGTLSLTLRRNCAAVRYWLWLAASVKFVVPLALLAAIGSQFTWRTVLRPPPVPFYDVIDQISQPFASAAPIQALPAVQPVSRVNSAVLVGVVWSCGFVLIAAGWARRWSQIRTAIRSASPVDLDLPVKVLSCRARLEPGFFGVFRPVLLMPEGIMDHLTPEQWKAILAHELSHVRRRDNLTAAIHMAVEAVFWFCPVVWWIGRRLADERERACDEEALKTSDPLVYAEGILTVCKVYLQAPLFCMSGVSGSDLRNRIRSIMTGCVAEKLNAGRKLLLAAVAIAAIAGPIEFGVVNGQSRTPSGSPVSFEVASVKPTNPRTSSPDGFKGEGKNVQGPGFEVDHTRFTATSINLFGLIVKAYGLTACRPLGGADCALLSGGPDWLKKSGFDVQAKMPDGSPDYTLKQLQNGRAPQLQLMLQSLLTDRFGLKIHYETRQLPIFELVVATKGPKFKKADAPEESKDMFVLAFPLHEPSPPAASSSPQLLRLEVQNGSMQELAEMYSKFLDRPVFDKTGLQDRYDFTVDYAVNPDAAGPAGPGFFKALKEQAGLELKATKGPVDVLVIDHAERPSKN